MTPPMSTAVDVPSSNSRSVRLPFVHPPVAGACGREVRRQCPPHRPVMGEVADRVDDVAHAPAGGTAAAPGQPRRGRQQRLAHRPFRPGHVRGVAAGPGAAGDPARAAPARHHPGDGGWLDIINGGRVERHAGLLASRWLRHLSDYQGPLTFTSATRPALLGNIPIRLRPQWAGSQAGSKLVI
jgi:hypothetical protein